MCLLGLYYFYAANENIQAAACDTGSSSEDIFSCSGQDVFSCSEQDVFSFSGKDVFSCSEQDVFSHSIFILPHLKLW
jgi:hypothetical protein